MRYYVYVKYTIPYVSLPVINLPINNFLFIFIIAEKYCVIWIGQDENGSGFLSIMNGFHTDTHQYAKQRMQSAQCIALNRIVSDRISAIVLFISPRIKSCFFNNRRKYCVIWFAQDENTTVLITIMNKFIIHSVVLRWWQ
jgi:hypothetical protein